MALLATIDAAEAWKTIRGNAKSIVINVPAINSELATSDVRLERIFEIYRVLKNSRDQLESLKLTDNLTAYVADVLNAPAYDVVAEISAVTAAQQSVLDWIDTNANGLSLTGDTAANYLANGSAVTNRFTPAQTAALRTLLEAVANSITE